MAKSFAYDRIFGSDIKPEIAEKLEARQKLNVGVNFGEPTADLNKNRSTFDGVNDMSSRMPWGRMWSVIQNYSLSPDLKTCQNKALENSENYKADVNINDIKVYQIGTADFTALNHQSSVEENKMKEFQSNNEFFRPGIGITSINMESSGHFGLIKSTVVQFKVFNYYDFDNIILPFFLTPGSTVFVDFGWDTAYAYDPNAYLKGSENKKNSFEYASFMDEIFGDNGMIGKSNGDLEVIVGIVSKYDVKMDAEGNFECTLTLTSQNYALLDYTQESGMAIDLEIENRVWDKVATRIKDEAGVDIKTLDNPNQKYGEITKKILATYVGASAYHKIILSETEEGQQVAGHDDALLNKSSAKKRSLKNFHKLFPLIPETAYKTGVYFRSLDNVIPSTGELESVNVSNSIYITFRLFSQILNSLLASRKELFTDGDISFDFDNVSISFNRHLYIRQIYSTHYDKKQLSFLYPTRTEKIKGEQKMWGGQKLFLGYAEGSLDELTEIDARHRINLGDLFINLDKILAIFRAEKSVEMCLKNVMKMINDESFGVINLELIGDGTIHKNVIIVDSNSIPPVEETTDDEGKTVPKMFEFKLFSPNTIADSVDLSMNMGNSKIANRLAIIGATADKMLFPASHDMKIAIAEADMNRDVGENQFFAHLPTTTAESASDYMMNHVSVFRDSLIKKQPSAAEIKQKNDEVERTNKASAFANASIFLDMKKKDDKAEKPTKSKYLKFKDKLQLKDNETSKYFPKNVFLDDIHTYFKYKIMDKEIETKSFSNVLLPYSCTLTIYGISGITPGNRFRVDYLPERYRERTYFVVTKVSHSLTSQGWKTTIVGDMRLYGDKIYKNIVQYKPQVHLSRRKLYSLGYGVDQMNIIQDSENGYKNPIEFYTELPANMMYRCRDEKATNFLWSARYDCLGTYEGTDYSCCKYN